jgi:hypothetical protein
VSIFVKILVTERTVRPGAEVIRAVPARLAPEEPAWQRAAAARAVATGVVEVLALPTPEVAAGAASEATYRSRRSR